MEGGFHGHSLSAVIERRGLAYETVIPMLDGGETLLCKQI